MDDRHSEAPAVRGSSASTAGNLGVALARIWQAQRPRVLERLERLDDAAVAVLASALEPGQREEARRIAHQLAGSLGTFGLPQATEVARRVETMLDQRETPTLVDPQTFAELVSELHRLVHSSVGGLHDNGPESDSEAVAPTAAPPTVMVVGVEEPLATQLEVEGGRRGLKVSLVANLGVVGDGADDVLDAVVVDLDGPGGDPRGLARLAVIHPQVPLIAITTRRRLDDRVHAARQGVRHYLQKPVTTGAVMDIIDQLRSATKSTASILAVDDDPVVLETLRALLAHDRVTLVTVDGPERFWEALTSSNPDLVVLDIDMPGVDGVELCRVLRADPRWQRLGVLFLTARSDPTTVRSVFEAGADDMVHKPVIGPELLARIRNRFERVDLQRRLAETDGLTGLLNRSTSLHSLERLVTETLDSAGELAVALLDLDHFKAVNDRHGHAAGDDVLRALADLLHAGRFGLAGRWGGEEFLVAMAVGRAVGVERLERLLADLGTHPFAGREGQPFTATFSAGIVEVPAEAADADSALRAADLALYRAKAAGRARVMVTGDSTGTTVGRRVDVVVVDDDDLLAGLVVAALRSQGWTVERLADGHAAVARLAGSGTDLAGRVVLLDVDLPGLDGMTVLRRLGRAGRLADTDVIMLTARAGEDEVLQALRLGAVDHVAKPFSVVVLVERVRHRLAR